MKRIFVWLFVDICHVLVVFRRVGTFAKSLRHVRPSVWNNSFPTGGVFMKYDIQAFFVFGKICLENSYWNLTKITGTLHEDVSTFMTVSRWILFRMNSIIDTRCRQNQTHFIFNKVFPPKIVPFMRWCQKMWWSQRGRRWQHILSRARCVLYKQGYTRAYALGNI